MQVNPTAGPVGDNHCGAPGGRGQVSCWNDVDVSSGGAVGLVKMFMVSPGAQIMLFRYSGRGHNTQGGGGGTGVVVVVVVVAVVVVVVVVIAVVTGTT
ncbi:unnamed protein product [Heligmosomoides polygyrus]|uniref:CUB domain-containing protein n=1 Tax=Heligmosomoides polygyrus TaxID=6339 RepID=A0A3P7YQK4_HELPZ|nr:unnamed protein product [Heligmosomoides polygyrus]